MNRKKIIFIVIGVILLVFVFVLTLSLKSKDTSGQQKSWWDFKIWIVWDDKEDFSAFITDFEKYYWKTINEKIESFNNWDEYNLALASAIVRWEAPDVFVLNNNEKSLFLENIIWIDPQVINPTDFINNYRGFLGDDLIVSIGEWKSLQKFLIWVPIWYESLGIYYNRMKWIQADDVKNWASLNAVISKQKEKYPDVIPLWIWRWSTVNSSEDIITQFFMLENKNKLEDVSWAWLKTAIAFYSLFADNNWNNSYDTKFADMLASDKTNIDLFSRGEISMIFWYPRLLNTIDEAWYRKSSLYAKPFPEHFIWWWKALVNYNYFVVNKNSTKTDLWLSLLKYMTLEEGITSYLNKFPYYLPWRISLEDDFLEKEILDWYNIVLKDFFNEDLELSSFDKWIKSIYDKEVVNILDNSSDYTNKFDSFRNYLICLKSKIINLENLSQDCK